MGTDGFALGMEGNVRRLLVNHESCVPGYAVRHTVWYGVCHASEEGMCVALVSPAFIMPAGVAALRLCLKLDRLCNMAGLSTTCRHKAPLS